MPSLWSKLKGFGHFARRVRGTVATNTTPSAAVKLSIAAQRLSAPLEGVTFLLGSEPLTPARRRTIEASGAAAAPLYGSTEAPWTGGQCRKTLLAAGDPALRAEIGCRARQYVERHHDIDRAVEEYLALLQLQCGTVKA